MARGRPLFLPLVLAALLGTAAAAADAPLLEPAAVAPAAARTPRPTAWSWGQAPIAIDPTGAMTWQPTAFQPTLDGDVRYIDFAAGDDRASGDRSHPWRHHPWDAAATDVAKACHGSITYVFKRGVTYRGQLKPTESGTPGHPIRLTSDPTWGEGEAVLCGALPVTSWTKGAQRADIPHAEDVWWADAPVLAKNCWVLAQDDPQRVDLARIPHWQAVDAEDPKSQWWVMSQPRWWENGCHRLTGRVNGHATHIAVDPAHLTLPPSVYQDAIIRSEFGFVMGTPYPSRVEAVQRVDGALGLDYQGIWLSNSEFVPAGCRYYLEDKPQFLTDTNEFWVERRGSGVRIYLRLPHDADPNHAQVEAGAWCEIIEAKALAHVAISGLTFRCTNTWFDLAQPGWGHPDVDNAAIRIKGACDDLTVAHCRFVEVAKALLVDEGEHGATHGTITFADNDAARIEHGAITVRAGESGNIVVLRNRLRDIGWRAYRQDWGMAIDLEFPQTMEVAGNDCERCYGSGIWVFGAKPSGSEDEVPFARTLIHHNRVVQSLLNACDWGGIETWQGGPHYIYSNVNGDVNGLNWGGGRGAYAFYFDGGYKNYLFNNICYGGSDQWQDKRHTSAAAIYEAGWTIDNEIFDNTFARFLNGSCWSPGGGRHMLLGNVWVDFGAHVFRHGKEKEDQGPVPREYPYETMVYSRNLCSEVSNQFGVFEPNSRQYEDAAAMAKALEAHHAMAGDVGEIASGPVVRDQLHNDFRPVAHSEVIGRGAQVFVPWSLARTVGEWHFRRTQTTPLVILDSHWYMTPYYVNRDDYWRTPTFPLEVSGASASDFGASPLEDWIPAALSFQGEARARCTDAQLHQPFTYKATRNHQAVTLTAAGDALATPDILTSNLLIEVHCRPQGATEDEVLVEKLSPQAGYRLGINRRGTLTLLLRSGATTTASASTHRIADGAWHHALVELERATRTVRWYVDGVPAGGGTVDLAPEASLSNPADLVVGGAAQGLGYHGAIDYLRIARGTLAEAHTSIEELYDWEFAGPSRGDFFGQVARSGGHDAGAINADP